jgi:hypothetical protein
MDYCFPPKCVFLPDLAHILCTRQSAPPSNTQSECIESRKYMSEMVIREKEHHMFADRNAINNMEPIVFIVGHQRRIQSQIRPFLGIFMRR